MLPLVNTKFAVHWAPSVSVCTPGWIAAVAAGAHVGAAEACETDGTRTEPVRRATRMRTRAEIFTGADTPTGPLGKPWFPKVPPSHRPSAYAGAAEPGRQRVRQLGVGEVAGQATCPSGRINTAAGAATSPIDRELPHAVVGRVDHPDAVGPRRDVEARRAHRG